MRRRLAIVLFGLVLASAGFFAAFAPAQSSPGFWLHCVGSPLACTETEPPTSTVTDTVTTTVTTTVTEPPTTTTTTEPDPPPPPPPPPPSGGETIIQNGQYVCRGQVNIDLLRITMNSPSSDGLVLAAGCTGTIRWLELSGPMADGIKVQNASANAARNVDILGGFVWCGPAASGVHQDGIQAMGGSDIHLYRVAFDCLGGGGGNYFPARGGSGATTPTRIQCHGCAFGPQHPNNVQIQTSVSSGIEGSLVCRPSSGRNPIVIGSTAQDPLDRDNVIAPIGDPRCTREGLLDYVRT